MNVNRKKIKTHFLYSSWIYILIIILSIMLWDIIYAMTEYRPPKDKVVELYVADNPIFDDQKFETVRAEIAETILKDMEEVNAFKLYATGSDDITGNMQINTYIMSGQGDVYIMGKERFQTYAAGGAFLPLDTYIEKGSINKENYDYKRGLATYIDNDDQKYTVVYGISLKNTPSLKKYGIDTDNSYIAILYSSGNDINSVKMLNYIINLE